MDKTSPAVAKEIEISNADSKIETCERELARAKQAVEDARRQLQDASDCVDKAAEAMIHARAKARRV